VYYGPGMNGWVMALIIVGNVIFWGFLVLAAITLIRYAKRGRVASSSHPASTPQQILAQRFARGDIGGDEYTRRLRVLAGSSTSPQAARA
jgi:putative membrane protein